MFDVGFSSIEEYALFLSSSTEFDHIPPYLSMIPSLLSEAALRFERYALNPKENEHD